MKAITRQQRKELDVMLSDLKRVHPRKYKYTEFCLNDLGTGVMLANIAPKGGAVYNKTWFMGYEAMWWFLKYTTYPQDLHCWDKYFKEVELKK